MTTIEYLIRRLEVGEQLTQSDALFLLAHIKDLSFTLTQGDNQIKELLRLCDKLITYSDHDKWCRHRSHGICSCYYEELQNQAIRVYNRVYAQEDRRIISTSLVEVPAQAKCVAVLAALQAQNAALVALLEPMVYISVEREPYEPDHYNPGLVCRYCNSFKDTPHKQDCQYSKAISTLEPIDQPIRGHKI